MSNVIQFPAKKADPENKQSWAAALRLADCQGKRLLSEFMQLCHVLTINEFLALNYPKTSRGKKEKLQPFNPDF